MPPVHEGDTLTQTHPLTDLDQIYAAFQTEWMARWDRHANTDDSRWEPIIDFVKIAIPNLPQMQYHPISYAAWQNAVGKKKATAAIGPDGVSKDDLLMLPWNHVQPVLSLLDDIEQGRACWPQQVVTGHIHALQKLPGAWKASQDSVPYMVFNPSSGNTSILRPIRSLTSDGKPPGQIVHRPLIGLGHMTRFCELLDLQLDRAKTYFWSNDAGERRCARQQAQPLQASARDLGAHMEYGRRNTNHMLRSRLQAMPRVWEALARSAAPYRQKVHALRVKGWPQAHTMGASASLEDTHIRNL